MRIIKLEARAKFVLHDRPGLAPHVTEPARGRTQSLPSSTALDAGSTRDDAPPSPINPQQSTSPVSVSAHVSEPFHRIAIACSTPSTAFASLVCAPDELAPQQSTWPAATRAHTGVGPAATSLASRSTSVATMGVRRSRLVPSPSCTKRLLPQHITRPASVTKQVCAPPAAIRLPRAPIRGRGGATPASCCDTTVVPADVSWPAVRGDGCNLSRPARSARPRPSIDM